MANLTSNRRRLCPTPDLFPREGEGRYAEGSGPASCRQWLLSAVAGPLPGPAYLPATGAGTDRCHHRLLEPPRRRTLRDPR